MVTYVLDASAVIRFLDDEEGADRVEAIFQGAMLGSCRAIISAVNWGEIVGKIASRTDKRIAHDLAIRISGFSLDIISADAKRSERAALLKVDHKIPYADAFGVDLATDSPDHILVTADFDAKPAEHFVRIEFLPTKRKH